MTVVTNVRVIHMYESCERHSYYVQLISDEGQHIESECHQTGSVYNDHEGLSKEEALDRALSDATHWADFFNLKPDPYIEDGIEIKPSWVRNSFTIEREIKQKRSLTIT